MSGFCSGAINKLYSPNSPKFEAAAGHVLADRRLIGIVVPLFATPKPHNNCRDSMGMFFKKPCNTRLIR